MTSTNFQIGLSESKNSSRVLRPPGGGHTDILCIKGDYKGVENTPSKHKNYGQSSIASCLFQEDNIKTVAKSTGEEIKTVLPDENANPEPETVTDENINPESDTVQDENTKQAAEPEKKDEVDLKKEATPMRRRVPPGGFSSGFW